MLCAGVTTYAALRKSRARSGDWVVISGAGGGLGHIACQLASRGMAMRVIGIDAPSKEDIVMECGAEKFVDVTAFDDEGIKKEVLGLTGGLGAQAVVVCTASNRAYAQALDFLKFDGTLVCEFLRDVHSSFFLPTILTIPTQASECPKDHPNPSQNPTRKPSSSNKPTSPPLPSAPARTPSSVSISRPGGS